MKLFLKSGGLTTLVAHLLTSRTLGKNPRVLTDDPAPFLSSFLFSSFLFFSHTEAFSHATLSLRKSCACPTFSSLFKIVQDRVFTASSPRERIKLGGCSLEFKSNLNSNANQPVGYKIPTAGTLNGIDISKCSSARTPTGAGLHHRHQQVQLRPDSYGSRAPPSTSARAAPPGLLREPVSAANIRTAPPGLLREPGSALNIN